MNQLRINHKKEEVESSTNNNNPLNALTQQIQDLQQQMQDMQRGEMGKYYLEDICAYPFDRSLSMISFPPNCEILKYDKYNGKPDPKDHAREICTMSLEFPHTDTYLMRLFPQILSGQTMEWLSKIMPSIRSFEELVKKFISQYSYNI